MKNSRKKGKKYSVNFVSEARAASSVVHRARDLTALATNGFIFQNKKPLFVLSHAHGGAENLVKRKDSELGSQPRCPFVNMLTDSQHTCERVSNFLFVNCHSISQDITNFSYIIMSTSCPCFYVNQVCIECFIQNVLFMAEKVNSLPCFK